MDMLRMFFRDEEGANLVEYALLVTLIAIAVVVAAGALGTNLSNWFSYLASDVQGWSNKAQAAGS